MHEVGPDPGSAAFELHDIANDILLAEVRRHYGDQLARILASGIDESFLGFVGTYHLLSQLIPTDRVIYDIGCANALQAWFFRDHEKYIGIDMLAPPELALKTENSEHWHMPVDQFVEQYEIDPVHFAICNYAPPWGAESPESVVRKHFRHLYIYYPNPRNPLSPWD